MKVHLTALHGYYSYSVPWDLDNPEILVPLDLPNTRSGAAIFLGHVKELSPSEYDVVGGDLMIRDGPSDRTFPKLWEQRLLEAGTVVVTPKNQEEVYYVAMEGDYFQEWHFNLFNPLTSKLITLSYSWGPDDPKPLVKKSANYDAPELADERALLEEIVHDPAYPIPFQKAETPNPLLSSIPRLPL
jgi:hypothetical protein